MRIAAIIAASLTVGLLAGLKMFIDELGRFCEDINPYAGYKDELPEREESDQKG